jgi:hypothetical protein
MDEVVASAPAHGVAATKAADCICGGVSIDRVVAWTLVVDVVDDIA